MCYEMDLDNSWDILSEEEVYNFKTREFIKISKWVIPNLVVRF